MADTAAAVIPDWLLEAEIEPRALVLYAHLSMLADLRRRVYLDAGAVAVRMRCTSVSVYRYLQALRDVGAVVKNGRQDYTIAWERPENVA